MSETHHHAITSADRQRRSDGALVTEYHCACGARRRDVTLRSGLIENGVWMPAPIVLDDVSFERFSRAPENPPPPNAKPRALFRK